MEIEIEGIKYVQKKPKQTSSKHNMVAYYALTLMMTLGGGMLSGSSPKQRPEVNLIEEFGLIQRKKSKLSKSERDWVVRQFYSNFETCPSN